MRLLIYEKSYRRLANALSQVAPGVEPLLIDDEGSLSLAGQVIDVDAARPDLAWGCSQLYVDGPVRQFMVTLLKAPGLRWMQSSAAGFEHPVFKMLSDKGTQLTNSNATAVAIAEFVMARVLSAFHPEVERRAAQEAKRWARLSFREISESTWLILGLGNIGSEVAARAAAFGANVIGVRRTPRGDEPVDRMIRLDEVRDVLPETDVLVVAVALNASSARLIAADELATMKSDAVLVNVARGPVIDEGALVSSLDAGRPGLAILDVFDEEPLAEDSPLWSHPRVRVTAHCAASSEGTVRRGDAIFLDNLGRFVRGEGLRFVVEPSQLG